MSEPVYVFLPLEIMRDEEITAAMAKAARRGRTQAERLSHYAVAAQYLNQALLEHVHRNDRLVYVATIERVETVEILEGGGIAAFHEDERAFAVEYSEPFGRHSPTNNELLTFCRQLREHVASAGYEVIILDEEDMRMSACSGFVCLKKRP